MERPRLDISKLRPWIEYQFDRSGGPGGQNVNKVNSRTTLYFDYYACEHISDAQAKRIAWRLAPRISQDGRLRIVAQTHRTQAGNRSAAESRLVELLTAALREPKQRIATRPTAGSRKRRVQAKRRKGQTKQLRSGRGSGDE